MAENSVADELSRLTQLRDAGVLTEAEFEAEKARLLAHLAAGPHAPYWRPDLPLYRVPKSRSAHRRRPSSLQVLGILVGCAIVVALIVVDVSHHGTSATAPSGPSATRRIGQVAKDGDFAFVVKSVSCGTSADAVVEGAGEQVPPATEECLVTMTVTDDTGTSQTYFSGNQYAYDSAGHQFSADATATESLISADDDTEVNPGATITAILPFQIPVNDRIARLELHDSAYSNGVTVDV
jgi:hypothetical protein